MVYSRFPSGPSLPECCYLVTASGAISALQNYQLQSTGEDIVRDARLALSKHLLRLPIREYDQRDSGDLLSRVGNDTSQLRNAFMQCTSALASGFITVIGSAAFMAMLDPILFGTAITLLLTVFTLMLLSAKFIERASYDSQYTLGDLTSTLNRDLAGIRTIRASNGFENENKVIAALINRVRLSGLKIAKIQSIVNPLATIALQLAAIIVFGLGLWRVTTGLLSVEKLTQFIMLLFISISPLSQIIYAGSQIGNSMAAMNRIREILDIPEEKDSDTVVATINEHMPLAHSGPRPPAVEFQHVYFSYGSKPILRDLNLSISQGSVTALVGPSGAGKSTILQLIERFYDPSSGNINVLGKDITTCDRDDLRSHIAYVEQDSPALSGSIRENLLLGSNDCSDDECRRVLESVNLSHLLDRSDKGLDMQIGENGIMLSGGERQRLAIARALLSTAKIILLDEATANLDADNERLITQLLTQVEGRTFIIVAHRLATIIDSDLIYVLNQGRIIGSGTHKQLFKTAPFYRNLATEQYIS
ncbi:ABC transporter ATP-binding protein [Bifidobacterium vespertilionis]|uniref:ABC transporter n=1 Tax=Bifidobacterium parmae TaxID=361854 RepID=A0A2N5J6A1_9BIFI|nr:ABC transporter ATP-binding protein [Bifidobacterium vespertilionis]PLS29733.1 ABC transporter [Bifidobacterium parmae]